METELLGFPPNSPDAAIFTNSTSTKTTPASLSPSSASDKSSDAKSSGTKLGTDHLLGSVLLIASAIFFCAFPPGV